MGENEGRGLFARFSNSTTIAHGLRRGKELIANGRRFFALRFLGLDTVGDTVRETAGLVDLIGDFGDGRYFRGPLVASSMGGLWRG